MNTPTPGLPGELLYAYQAQHGAAYDRLRHRRYACRAHHAMRVAAARYRTAVLGGRDDTVLVWSDLHLGHEHVIDFAERPFVDVADQDAQLWRAWAEDVDRDDIVVVVGDLAMGPARNAATWARVAHAPGRKILVVGNHDVNWREADWREIGGSGELRLYPEGFDEVRALLVAPGDPPLVWTQYPLEDVPDGWVNVHGHEHHAPPRSAAHVNVGVEQLEYRPIRLDRLRRLARYLVAGEDAPGVTTLERIQFLEGERR